MIDRSPCKGFVGENYEDWVKMSPVDSSLGRCASICLYDLYVSQLVWIAKGSLSIGVVDGENESKPFKTLQG